MLGYWRRDVGRIQVYRYHLEKPGHSLLLGMLGALFGIPSVWAVSIAALGYLLVGKWLVRSKPSKDWVADAVIGALAIVAVLCYTADPWANTALLVWCGLYGWLVLDWRWASP